MDYCPTCKSDLKSGQLLKYNNQLIKKETTAFINAFTDENKRAYCDNCVRKYLWIAKRNYKSMEKESTKALDDFINSFPVLTIENPSNWQYEILGLVSFSTTVSSQSDARDKGEAICLQEIKRKTHNLGGNAIIGAKIGYSSFHASNIINTYGTAIKILNTELFSDSYKNTQKVNMGFITSRDLLKQYEKIFKLL